MLPPRPTDGTPETRAARVVAIAGNPNAGKTSLFNALTGAARHVGNYPGVTVELKEGRARGARSPFTVVDLPGCYGLTAYSQEERVARDFLLCHHPDVVIDVVDASNLERNLYLTAQFLELKLPVIIALNMVDVAEKRGMRVDHEALTRMLGVPVIPTIATRGTGIDHLLETCEQVLDGALRISPQPIRYGHPVDELVVELAGKLKPVADMPPPLPTEWLAVKLLENDPAAWKRLKEHGNTTLTRWVESTQKTLEHHCNRDGASILAERRHGFAAGAARQCVSRQTSGQREVTDRIDDVVCHWLAGPALLIGVVAALFFWVFKLSDEWTWIPWPGEWKSPTGVIEACFTGVEWLISPIESPFPMLHSLLHAALVRGVGGVLSFVPLIFFMFLFIAFLEDSGYIARVAFILDRLLRVFGLQGKSMLAMLIAGGIGAGGCAVPAVMATRTLREEKDRIVTMLVAPFMNCGAKLPVYAMLIAAFFPYRRTVMMLLLWGLSWVFALCAAWLLRRTVVRGEQTPFVMELPPYHLPTIRGVLMHTWERTWAYIRKAGTIILAVNIVLWAFMYFPRPVDVHATPEQQLRYSMAGRVGTLMEPVSGLAGFDWRTNVALIGGFAAKEVIIGAMATAYAMIDAPDSGPDETEIATSLSGKLASDPAWNPLRAFALMLFIMLYAPCMSTIAVMRRESGGWRWPIFSLGFSTALAFLVAVTAYQAGLALGLG